MTDSQNTEIEKLHYVGVSVDNDGEHEYYEIVKLSKAESVYDEEIDGFVELVKSESEW